MEQYIFDIAQKNKEAIIDYGIIQSRIQLKQKTDSSTYIDHIPFSVIPYQMNGDKLNKLIKTQEIWNTLIMKIGMDDDFLEKTFGYYQQTDTFIKRIYQIYQKVRASPIERHAEVVINRNDFMMDNEDNWKQIEYNLIACVYPHRAQELTSLHSILLSLFPETSFKPDNIHPQPEQDTRLLALLHAHSLYGKAKSVILFVVGSFESNIFEQRDLQMNCLKRGISCIRKTFEQLQECLQVNSDNILIVDGQEVSVVYYRTGYQLEQYGERGWEIRENMELSMAIKIPSVRFQLVNFKIIQCLMDRDDLLGDYLQPTQVLLLRNQMVNTCMISTEQDRQKYLVETTSKPHQYVLKPQKEGGGNNFYNQQIPEQLQEMTLDELKLHLLMARITPKGQPGLMMINRELVQGPVVTELGLLSFFSCTQQNIISNHVDGYLCRTKLSKTDEGGITLGYAAVDSIIVTSNNQQQ